LVDISNSNPIMGAPENDFPKPFWAFKIPWAKYPHERKVKIQKVKSSRQVLNYLRLSAFSACPRLR